MEEDVDCFAENEDEDGVDWNERLLDGIPPFQEAEEADNNATTSCSGSTTGNADDRVVRMELNDHKAGMKGLDKAKINQIIYENSKGSKFFENEKKKEKRVEERISAMRLKLQQFSEQDRVVAAKEADVILASLEAERDLDKIIVHIDMDAFYAAVEMRDRPELKNIPMAVGGMNMLSTSNYEARRYGVRAAMPGFIAKKLCPQLTIVSSNFSKYREVSNVVKDVLREYDPNLVAMSLDEAYLDLTDYVHNKLKINSSEEDGPTSALHSSENCVPEKRLWFMAEAENVVEELRSKIHNLTRLTASAGIACNTLLAKVGSDFNKPNGQFCIPPIKENILNFIKDLSIRKISGIGRVSEQVLKSLGITKCCDIYPKRQLIKLLFSDISCLYYLRVSLGISSSSLVDGDEDRKSMSRETTFGEKSRPEDLYDICLSLCKQLSLDLKSEELCAKCISIKLKLTSFRILSRSKTITSAASTAEEIYAAAKGLLDIEIRRCLPQSLKLRLMGVRASTLSSVDEQGPKMKQRMINFNQERKLCSISSPQKESNDSVKNVLAIAGKSVECEASYGTENQLEEETAPSSNLSVTCPVCGTFKGTNESINTHIDSCLNRSAIRDILSDCNDSKAEGSGRGKGNKRQAKPKASATSNSKKSNIVKVDRKNAIQNYFKEPSNNM